MSLKKLIALIPARSGSERIKNKNLIKINGKTLLKISIENAVKSKIFEKIIVSTDSKKYARLSKSYGAEVPFLRPKRFSGSTSPDYDWVSYTLNKLNLVNLGFTHFFILRPTNPFRTYKTILKAWNIFKKNPKCESLRAIENCKQHPYKMWIKKKQFIKPLFNKTFLKQPAYNTQFKTLPKIYIQNASLEISKLNVLKKYKSITGKKIIPFKTERKEGFDINYVEDVILAKKINKKNK